MRKESHAFSFILKQNWRKWLLLLALFSLTLVATAADNSGNNISIWEQFINDIRGNLLYDLLKFFSYAIFVLSPAILLSLFFQSFHVILFQYGSWYGIPNYLKGEKFGTRVNECDKKAYRKFESHDRQKVVDSMNVVDPKPGVFLIMGPTGVGKRLLTFS